MWRGEGGLSRQTKYGLGGNNRTQYVKNRYRLKGVKTQNIYAKEKLGNKRLKQKKNSEDTIQSGEHFGSLCADPNQSSST